MPKALGKRTSLWKMLQIRGIQLPIENICLPDARKLWNKYSAPKTAKALIKLRLDEAMSPWMKKLEEFLAYQRKLKKVALKRLWACLLQYFELAICTNLIQYVSIYFNL